MLRGCWNHQSYHDPMKCSGTPTTLSERRLRSRKSPLRYLALLRGINVGGKTKLPMADLRGLLETLGHTNISTYIQSGNAVFTSDRNDPEKIAKEIERIIEAELALKVTVMIRTREEMRSVIKHNAFVDAEEKPATLHAAFLSEQPEQARVEAFDTRQFVPDRLQVGDGVAYLWYPNGAGRSKLTNSLIERQLGVRATARNWNTVLKLFDLMGE